jgi:hypothetical protein
MNSGLSATLATRKPLPCFSQWPIGNSSVKFALHMRPDRQRTCSLAVGAGQTNGGPTCGLFSRLRRGTGVTERQAVSPALLVLWRSPVS